MIALESSCSSAFSSSSSSSCCYSTTNLSVARLGDAVVLDLTAAIPPPKRELPDAHMTLLFRRGGFHAAEVARVQACVDAYIAADDAGGTAVDPGQFQLRQWGRASELVLGPLADLCAHVQKMMGHVADRPPHVALRAVNRR